ASPARTVEWLPSVRGAAWARALVVLLPSVLLLPVAPTWIPAQVLSAPRAVEPPPSVLLAAWAPKPAVLLPMVPGLYPRRAASSACPGTRTGRSQRSREVRRHPDDRCPSADDRWPGTAADPLHPAA